MREIKVGQKYRHFKGMEVVVEIIAKDSETLDKMVVYKHIGKDEYWIRPYDMFNSLVDRDKYPDATQEHRFEEII